MIGKKCKTFFGCIIMCVLAGALIGCGSDGGSSEKTGTGVYSTSKSVNDVLEEQAGNTDDGTAVAVEDTDKDNAAAEDSSGAAGADTSEAEGMDAVNRQLEEADKKATAGGDVDVDLTKLTSTMVYSEVYNMVSQPSEYMGKTVRMKGITSIYHDDVDNNDYYACVIQDATACCAQGIEFVLDDGKYPEANTEVTVVGTFSSYKIEDYEYYTLVNAVME